MVLDILSSYSFQVVAIGTTVLAAAAGMIGTINVLKGQSLIGDAIGHSAYPGVILAFMVFMSRNSLVLTLGSMFMGVIAFLLIQLIEAKTTIKLNNILALVLSTMFGLGMVLNSYIQGNSNFEGAAQAGLNNYIFGQAAYMMTSDVILIIISAVVSLAILGLFYQQFKIYVFDEIYAKTVGIKTTGLNLLILIMTMSIIAVGLKAVGAILISSLLIAPGVAALQWSDRFGVVISLAGVIGAISGLVGSYISTAYYGMPTGPTIILVMTIMTFFSIIFGPRGTIRTKLNRQKEVK